MIYFIIYVAGIMLAAFLIGIETDNDEAVWSALLWPLLLPLAIPTALGRLVRKRRNK